jgi:phthalate 4,5-cis-dihydrodiol dehydrogenase
LGGGLVRSLRAQVNVLDPARPTEAGCMALLQFDNGAAASLTYSGYDHFDSDEWHFGIGERGARKPLSHGAARRALETASDESRARTEQFAYRGAANLPPHQPHFGVTIVTCARGDLRASAEGVMLYDKSGMRELPLPRGGGMPGRREVLDDMRAALRAGKRLLHDGRWGKATLEVALAIQQSAREGREIALAHQVAVDDSAHPL